MTTSMVSSSVTDRSGADPQRPAPTAVLQMQVAGTDATGWLLRSRGTQRQVFVAEVEQEDALQQRWQRHMHWRTARVCFKNPHCVRARRQSCRKWLEEQGVLRAAEKLAPQRIRDSFVTGHDLSRAANAQNKGWALAPEGLHQASTAIFETGSSLHDEKGFGV